MSPTPHPLDDSALRATAAQWTIRRDRGLSATESIEYELWLTADPRHARAMHRCASVWSLLERIPEGVAAPVLVAATRRRSFWRRTMVIGSLAAAAALALVALLPTRPSAAPAPAGALTSGPRQITLPDGTVVHLNTGGEVIEQFTANERRVRLAAGEAHFAVTKDPARPFVVQAKSIDVRAVGTAFNVSLQPAAVEVLVTEGIVQLDRSTPSVSGDRTARPVADLPRLTANERAVVSFAGTLPGSATSVVTTATPEEIAHALAWQEPLLRLGGATLAELVLEFQRRSGQRVILADPALASLRVGGRFRGNDLAGFTHLLATTLDLEVDVTADGTLVLRKKS
ncbi:MAG: FecR domain-containing protein [Lacunisphaera sp.]|nr:FecR domain-containing protein [Lacunisphaera sp.]